MLAKAWDDGLAADPEMTVAEWADRYRILSSRGGSAEAGPYRTSRTPYLKEILYHLSSVSQVRRVVFKKAAQIGGSEAGVSWVGYIIDQVPGPIMLVQPTVETAMRFSNQRIQPLIDDCPQLAAKVAKVRSRNAANTMLLKEFRGGVLIITGANSAVGLRSMPVRYLMLDEVDAYPFDLEDEGDPVALAEARTRTFSVRSKVLIVSTPKLKGISRICREFEATDQRFYHVPCPHCRHKQVLKFERMHWQPGRPETVHYQCEKCDGAIREHHKTRMLAGGEWKATAECRDPLIRGYHLSALYSPVGWLSWAEIAKHHEAAVEDIERRKTFINTVLGEAFEEEADAVPEWERLYERRESWPYHSVPERGLFLTAGADVQADRIEISVWAWGRGLESWLVEHVVLAGDPGHQPVWQALTEFLDRKWPHVSGKLMELQRLAIDSGGFTQSVYAWVRRQPRSLVLPVRGVPNYDRTTPVSGPSYIDVLENGKRYRRGIALWTVAVSTFKRELYKFLILPRPTDEEFAAGARYPAGTVHLPDTVGDEWIKQLVAEQLVIVRTRTGTRTEWRALRARNEALDCRNYARAAVWLAGCDRWPEARWRDLELQLGLDPPPPDPPPAPAAAPPVVSAGLLNRPPPPQPRRRMIGYWQG